MGRYTYIINIGITIPYIPYIQIYNTTLYIETVPVVGLCVCV